MVEQHHEDEGETDPKQGGPSDADQQDEKEHSTTSVPLSPRARINPATFPPVIDPAIFANYFAAMDPVRFQVAAVAQAIAPITQRLSRQVAESIALAWPKIDLTPLLDASQLLPKIDFSPSFRKLLEDFRRLKPPNWPSDIRLAQVVEITRDDGLPLVWVPRAEIVRDLIAAHDREARVALLLARVPELVQDCRDVLGGVSHEMFAGQKQLAGRCVDALEQEHYEAAQALAVVVIETAVSRTLGGDYAKVKQQVLLDPDLVPFTEVRLRVALAPIYRFYTAWKPQWSAPPPEALSRHVAVHQADPSHYTKANSVVGVLLACSVLRALQELQELAEASGLDQETT